MSSTKSLDVIRLHRGWYLMSAVIHNYSMHSVHTIDWELSRPSIKRCIQTRNRRYRHITGHKANSIKGLY